MCRASPKSSLCFSALQRAENSSISTQLTDKAIASRFSALQRAENSSIIQKQPPSYTPGTFQCSSASRKFLNRCGLLGAPVAAPVSVLFSEPKIPQSQRAARCQTSAACFSALQRAENSSIPQRCDQYLQSVWFQCSSASRKFLNKKARKAICLSCFMFQCSSASRKFLNSGCCAGSGVRKRVSVLFSEPKIPQSSPGAPSRRRQHVFQCSSASRKFLNSVHTSRRSTIPLRFSALQRAENSSIQPVNDPAQRGDRFQCSSASRKFLNPSTGSPPGNRRTGFSALQRAENSSI